MTEFMILFLGRIFTEFRSLSNSCSIFYDIDFELGNHSYQQTSVLYATKQSVDLSIVTENKYYMRALTFFKNLLNC